MHLGKTIPYSDHYQTKIIQQRNVSQLWPLKPSIPSCQKRDAKTYFKRVKKHWYYSESNDGQFLNPETNNRLIILFHRDEEFVSIEIAMTAH